jgi:hypothetical protein
MHVHERDDQGFQFRYYNFFNGPKIIKIWPKFHQFFFLRILNMKYDFLKCLVLN